jgi:hypothetical protein
MRRFFVQTFVTLSVTAFLSVTMTPASFAASEDTDWSEWFLREFETARLPKKSDFNTRQVWNADSVKVLHYSDEEQIPALARYFVIDPNAGEIGTSRLLFGTFSLVGKTYNPHTSTWMRQNRMIPVIFGAIYQDTVGSDQVVFSTEANAAVMALRNGKSVITVRVKGSGKNLNIFAIDRTYSSDGDLLTSTYSFMDTLLYKRGSDGNQWIHPAHELEFTVPPQPE